MINFENKILLWVKIDGIGVSLSVYTKIVSSKSLRNGIMLYHCIK